MKNLISEIVINAMGNQNFNSEHVFEALKDIKHNGSTTALLNLLPELEALAKKQYGNKPKLGRKK